MAGVPPVDQDPIDPQPAAVPQAAPPAVDAALAAALTQLANAINNFAPAAAGPGGAIPAAPVPLLDPFASNAPFDLSTRSGLTAFTQAGSALDDLWDGTVDKFPSFVIGLRVKAQEVRWNAAPPHGILSINGNNLLTNYHALSEVDIEAARAARVDPRAIQNSQAMYICLKSSITGELKSLIYSQDGNLPHHEDGPLLFKKLTSLTMSSSLQLSNVAFENILQFDPVSHDFSIPTINTQLNHLFILASTQARQLGEAERIHHTLTTYGRICQPEEWAQWIRTQFNRFDDGNITVCQDFMNRAVLQYNRIKESNEGAFKGSTSTVQEDIVAMLSATKKQKTTAASPANQPSTKVKKLPPFARHYKTSSSDDAKEYKVGDSKVWNNQTWYFCDAPTHKDKIKWHTHTAESCRTRKNWLASKIKNEGTEAHSADSHELDDENSSLDNAPNQTSTTQPINNNTDITGLLTHALTIADASANDAVKDMIAEAINALHYNN